VNSLPVTGFSSPSEFPFSFIPFLSLQPKTMRLSHKLLNFATLAFVAAPAVSAQNAERAIRYEFEVAAPVADVWNAWTTEVGLRSFFSPTSRIDLRVFGVFDIHDNKVAGDSLASRPNIILAIQPTKLLVTTWDTPREIVGMRHQRTVLMITLAEARPGITRVSLVNTGYTSGGDWDTAFDYFSGAWTFVAAALQHRFANGPINWSSPPDLRAAMVKIGGAAAQQWIDKRMRRAP
jgi:uncharacterized protein YndB with AHSA1/START domain